MGDYELIPKKGRNARSREPTEEGKRRMLEGSKKPKPATGLAKRAFWQRSFMVKNPLKKGEIYIRYTNLRNPTIQEVIVVASDAHRVEYSRDGVEWKPAKGINYHARNKL